MKVLDNRAVLFMIITAKLMLEIFRILLVKNMFDWIISNSHRHRTEQLFVISENVSMTELIHSIFPDFLQI